MEFSGVVVVTGTGTDVGKTMVTAALAAAAVAAGRSVAVVKPVQTGVSGDEPGDAAVAATHAGLAPPSGCHEYTRLRLPLAPDLAARLEGTAIAPVAAYAPRILDLTARHDLVLVEGAGGLLVRLDTSGGTLADLAGALPGSRTLVVVAAGLGTLNHAELTVEALRRRNLPIEGMVIGAWPAVPDLAARENLRALPEVTRVPLLGLVPDGAGALPPGRVRVLPVPTTG